MDVGRVRGLAEDSDYLGLGLGLLKTPEIAPLQG